MASVKTWLTKEEVLKDLAKASGRKTKHNEDLDMGHLVIGDAPPPVLFEDEDDQMALLFGDGASRKAAQTLEDAPPDLAGIQEMLRMVQNYNSDDDEDLTNGVPTSSDCVISISKKVSKLNPNVAEFIPKGASSSSQSKKNSDYNSSPCSSIISDKTSNTIGKKVSNTNITYTQPEAVGIEDSSNEVKKDENFNDDVTNIQEKNEYEDIATKLKNKISDAAKSDSFELKKQKNVAIATLLRLYASNNKTPKQSTENLKLFTPEYFEGKKVDSDDKIATDTKASLTVSSETSTSTTPEPKNSSTTIPTCSSTSLNSTPLQTSSENNLLQAKPKINDPEVKRSIEKVNKWFEEPTKRKSPAVCLGPFAFKRKNPSSCKSPVSDAEQKVTKPPASAGQRYQPSNYAADLGKKYMERNKIKEDQKKEVNWMNLGEILKEKDKAIRKRLDEQTSASDSNESVGPRR